LFLLFCFYFNFISKIILKRKTNNRYSNSNTAKQTTLQMRVRKQTMNNEIQRAKRYFPRYKKSICIYDQSR